MSKDTIYRQDAIDEIESMKSFNGMWNNCIKTCADAMKHLPSAKPEIIRCRDCQNYYFADNRIPQEQRHVCSVNGEKWNPDDYCSFAERRTDERHD